MVILSFVKYGNIHNAINFTFSIPCDAYLHIFYGLLHTFSSGLLRFCQQNHFSSLSLLINIAILLLNYHVLILYLYSKYPDPCTVSLFPQAVGYGHLWFYFLTFFCSLFLWPAFSVWVSGHVSVELNDQQWPVPAVPAHPVHPGLVPAL